LAAITERSDAKAIASLYKDRRLRASTSPNSTAASLLEQVEAEVYKRSDIGGIYEILLKEADTDSSVDVLALQIKLLELYRKQLPLSSNKGEVSVWFM
jgi:hypothetical protein